MNGAEHSLELPVLGIRTRFETNSRDVLDLVGETFADWRAVEETGPVGATVRIIVHNGSEGVEGRSPVQYISADDGRLLLHSAGSVAVVDPTRRQSLANVTAQLVADSRHFRDAVLEAITFALLAGLDRHPVHAAAIVRDRHALLLAAPSGTGKSTLTYLAHTAGIDVLSDDRVWVQLVPSLRIWGSMPHINVRPDAFEHCRPERSEGPAPGCHPERSERVPASAGAAGDSSKLTIPLGSAENPRTLFADTATVCILERGSRLSLDRLDGSAVEAELTRQLAQGFDRFPHRHDAVMRALTPHGGWRLILAGDPRDALPSLSRMLDDRFTP